MLTSCSVLRVHWRVVLNFRFLFIYFYDYEYYCRRVLVKMDGISQESEKKYVTRRSIVDVDCRAVELVE